MKKKFLLVMTMVFVFGLFATVFAVSRTNAENAANCPMQNAQTAAIAEKTDLSKVPVFISEENCCKPGADCCKGGVCCKKKK